VTDDRNGGATPPPSEPAAPPPLAAAPPPVSPIQPPTPPPVPAPYYPPVSSGSGSGRWILFIILAFAAGVGLTILTLWLTGDLWNDRSSSYSPSSYGSSSGSGTSSYGSTSPSFSSVPTDVTIIGTWGTRCPSSVSDAVTFASGNRVSSDGDSGTFSVSGNYVTVNTSRQTLNFYWEMIDANTARVRRSGDSQTRMIYRCT